MMTLAGLSPAGGESPDGEAVTGTQETEISEPVTEPEPEPVSESRIEPKSDSEPVSEPKADSATGTDGNSGTSSNPGSDSGTGDEPKETSVADSDGNTGTNSDSGSDSGTGDEPKNTSAADSDGKTGTNSDSGSDSGTGNQPKDDPATDPDGNSGTNSDSGTDPGSGDESKDDPVTDPNPDTGTNSETGSDSGTDDESKDDPVTEPDTETGSNSEMGSDSDPVSESGADQEPNPDSGQEPNPETDPDQDPQQKPDPNADPDPEQVTIQIAAAVSEGAALQNGVYVIPQGQNADITFSWSFSDACDMFHIQITGAQNTAVHDGTQTGDSYTLPLSSLSEGSYIFKVYAITEGNTVGAGQYPFSIAFSADNEGNTDSGDGKDEGGDGKDEGAEGKEDDAEGGEGTEEGTEDEAVPGEEGTEDEAVPGEGEPEMEGPGEGGPGEGGPGGGGPGRSPGGRPSGNGEAQGVQAPRVTAGKALTSTHASGSKTMETFGTVNLSFSDESLTTLWIHDRAGIQLDEGDHTFTATVEDESLILTPEVAGEIWTVNGYTLKALSRSGITGIIMMTEAGETEISTEQDYQGTVYATLCASGVVSADYEYQISGDGIQVLVAGSAYSIDDSHMLVPVK